MRKVSATFPPSSPPAVKTGVLWAYAENGQLQALQWVDLTCNSCGGPTSKQCLTTTTSQPQHSCAGDFPAQNAAFLVLQSALFTNDYNVKAVHMTAEDTE